MPTKRFIKYLTVVFVLLAFYSSASAIVGGSLLDMSSLPPQEVNRHLKTLIGQPIDILGVVKDASHMESQPLVYSIPTYWHDGLKYVKYGVVCQRQGVSKVIFADEGFLSLFVKKNVTDKTVKAEGKLLDGSKIAGLPGGIVFVLKSLRLAE